MADPSVLVERKRVTLELIKLFIENTSNEERWKHIGNPDDLIGLYNKIYNGTK